MRALVIAPQPFFTPRGTPFSVYYRTLVMAERGVEIDLLTFGEGQNPDIPHVRIRRIPRFSFLGPVKIGPSPLKAFLDIFMVVWTVGLLLRHRYDFVHAHEESVFWCRFLKPIFQFQMVYDMHSSLPQQLTNFNFTKSKLLIGVFKRLEHGALKHSNAVITICPDLRDYVLKHGIDPKRNLLIENSVFEDVRLKGPYTGTSKCTTTIEPKPNGPRVVYAGTFEAYQGIDILIKAFAEVIKERPDVEMLLVGGTWPQVEAMKRLAADCGLDGSCVFTGRVPKSQARAYVDTADVLVSPRTTGTNTPLKVYEQLATGKPLVATNIWSHTQVLSDEVCFLVDPTPDSFAKGILEALNNMKKAKGVVNAALKLYETAYSRPAYEQKIGQLLETLK